jgi:hypothetical protein
LKIGEKAKDLNLESLIKGSTYNTATESTNAKTPPNLLGIERKIA